MDISVASEAAQRLVDYYVDWKKPVKYIKSWDSNRLTRNHELDEYTKIYHDQLFSTLPTNLSGHLRQHLTDALNAKSNADGNSIPSLDLIGAQSLIELLSAEILYAEIRQEVDNNRGQWDTPILDDLRRWIAHGNISARMLSVMSVESHQRWSQTWLQRFDYYACEHFAKMR